MTRLHTIVMTLAATVLTAGAAPRIAMVRVQEIYASLPSTAAMQQEIKTQREQIFKDKRAEDLKKAMNEIKGIQEKIQDKANPPTDDMIRNLKRDLEIKQQEARKFKMELDSFRAEQEKIINRKTVNAIRASLKKIMDAAQLIAKENGCDMALDGSGNTNTGIPFVVYKKDAPDITDAVKAALKEPAPVSAPAPAANPAPAVVAPAPAPPTTPAPAPAPAAKP